jgi:serine/threonine-protein kinase
MQRHWFVDYLTETELADVRKMAESAIAIAPHFAQGHVALGTYFYFGYRQYDQALAEFQRAIELQPNNLDALAFKGYVHRRQGRWAESFTELKKCLEQDPRNPTLPANIASSYLLLRMWKEANQVGRRSIALDPHDVVGMRSVLLSRLNSTGDITEAGQALATFPPDSRIVQNSVAGGLSSVMGERSYFFVVARDYAAALKVWDNAGTSPVDQRRSLSARAAIHFLAGDLVAAQTDAEKAKSLLDDRLRERPDDILALTQLSWIHIALKRNEDALKNARRAAQLFPPEKDSIVGTFTLTGLAEVEARIGETADAVSILRELLSIPAGQTVSSSRLKIDPVWDPIRNDPRFQKLLTEKELIGPGE